MYLYFDWLSTKVSPSLTPWQGCQNTEEHKLFTLNFLRTSPAWSRGDSCKNDMPHVCEGVPQGRHGKSSSKKNFKFQNLWTAHFNGKHFLIRIWLHLFLEEASSLTFFFNCLTLELPGPSALHLLYYVALSGWFYFEGSSFRTGLYSLWFKHTAPVKMVWGIKWSNWKQTKKC